MSDALFDFLEANLAGGVAIPPHSGAVDLVTRVAELANADWTDDEAAHEMTRFCTYEEIRVAQVSVLAALVQNPATDLHRIRVSRILWRALDQLEMR